MGAIQSSINQVINTSTALLAGKKHLTEQAKANEAAKLEAGINLDKEKLEVQQLESDLANTDLEQAKQDTITGKTLEERSADAAQKAFEDKDKYDAYTLPLGPNKESWTKGQKSYASRLAHNLEKSTEASTNLNKEVEAIKQQRDTYELRKQMLQAHTEQYDKIYGGKK